MDQIIVTGGAGFLGSHLCERLLAGGRRVLCLDDFSSGSRRNVQQLLQSPSFELLNHDVVHPYHTQVDRIFNLASPASPIQYQLDPVQTLKTNVFGSLNMLELAKQSNARILQASTSEVYGDPETNPQREDYWGHVNPIGIRACYDEGKRSAEALFFDFHRKHQVEIKVIRIFNTFGPRMRPDDGRVISSFIVQALRGDPITIFGDGQQTRSFCYVTDLVDAMLALMDTPPNFTGPINIGNPNQSTVLEIAETILRLVGSRSRLVFQALPSDDPRQRCPDITLAKEALGWAPKVGLEDGLRETIAYLRRQL